MKALQIRHRSGDRFLPPGSVLFRHALLATLPIVVFVLVTFGQQPAVNAATLFYVGPDGSDSNPGTLAQPFLTVQRGVNAAGPGDTIVVRDGTYLGGCAGNRSFAVTINKAGTSAAWITLKAENKWEATLDSRNVCHSFINLGSSAAYWVIQDFRVINGYGGGIWSNSGADYITLRGNEIAFIGRHYLDSSIGICGSYANSASHDLIFDGNLFHDIGRTGGQQTFHDHALYLHSQNTTIVNNVFQQPIAGWGIQTASGFSGLIANNTFHGPHASREGQIMLWDSNGSVTVRNNIFHLPLARAITAYVFYPASCVVDYNIVYGSGTSLGAPASCSISNNRLNTDPLLANATSAPFDFHLRPGSPAIDIGATVPAAGSDFDAVARPQGSAYDVGAFEYYSGKTSVNRPYFEPAWVVNLASFWEGLSPGALATIFGFRLTSGATGLGSPPFPTVLVDTRVYLSGLPLDLQFASEQQINFVVPADTPLGAASLVVSTPSSDSSPVPVTVQAAAPGIFVFPDTDHAGVIVRSGAEMKIYCTGLGAVNSVTGQSLLPVTVWVDLRQLTPLFSGSVPDYPGLYVVRADIPPNLTGEQTVSIEVNGIRSNEVKFRVE